MGIPGFLGFQELARRRWAEKQVFAPVFLLFPACYQPVSVFTMSKSDATASDGSLRDDMPKTVMRQAKHEATLVRRDDAAPTTSALRRRSVARVIRFI